MERFGSVLAILLLILGLALKLGVAFVFSYGVYHILGDFWGIHSVFWPSAAMVVYLILSIMD